MRTLRTGFYQEIFGRPLATTQADIRKRIDDAVEHGDAVAHLRALLDLAFAELHMGSMSAARTAASSAASLAVTCRRDADAAEAALWFSMCQHFSNDMTIATSFGDVRAALVAHGLANYVPVASVLEAREALRKGLNQNAAELVRSAIAAMRTVDDPYVHAFVARTAALLHLSLGRADEAVVMAEESVDVASLSAMPMQEARSLTTLGTACLTLQQTGKSLTAFLRALDIYSELRSEDWYVASTYRGLAELHLASLDYESAVPYAERSLDLFRACGDMEEAAAALLTLGTAAQAMGNEQRALDLYSEAESLFSTHTSRHRMASIPLSRTAEIQLRRGHVDMARTLLEQALERAERNTSAIGMVHALSALGTLYSSDGFSNANPETADALFARAATYDVQLESPSIDLREARIAFLKRQHRYAEALALTEEVQQLHAIHRNETLQRRIAQVEAMKHVEEARHVADIERQRNAELLAAQAKLVESEKMASLGQLTAGIAHEINNPVTFIASSIEPLRRDIEEYEAIRGEGPLAEELRTEIAALLAGIENGARRTAEIVRSLRIFSRLDEGAMKNVDLIEGIQSTLTILRSRLSSGVNLQLDLQPLPLVECRPGEINQVFMNVISNAIDAVEHVTSPAISVSTMAQPQGCVTIRIADNGPGIPEHVRERLFEPFFTTKDVGKGTGLGLSISYGIIDRHHGRIEASNNNGAVFTIQLPIVHSASTRTH